MGEEPTSTSRELFRVTWEALRVRADGSLVVTIPPNTVRVLVQEGNDEEQGR